MNYLDGLRLYIQGYAKTHGIKLTKSELKEVTSEARYVLDSQLETAIHNAQTDFVC